MKGRIVFTELDIFDLMYFYVLKYIFRIMFGFFKDWVRRMRLFIVFGMKWIMLYYILLVRKKLDFIRRVFVLVGVLIGF